MSEKNPRTTKKYKSVYRTINAATAYVTGLYKSLSAK